MSTKAKMAELATAISRDPWYYLVDCPGIDETTLKETAEAIRDLIERHGDETPNAAPERGDRPTNCGGVSCRETLNPGPSSSPDQPGLDPKAGMFDADGNRVKLDPADFALYRRKPTIVRAVELDFDGELRDSRGVRRFLVGDYYCENDQGCRYLTSAPYMSHGYDRIKEGESDQPRPTREEVEESLKRVESVMKRGPWTFENIDAKALAVLRRAVEPRPAPLPEEVKEALATIEHSLAAYERRFGEDDADTRDALATLRRVLARRGRE